MVQGNEPSVQWIEVDAGALEHNLSLFRSLLQPETALLGVVKANAYGHGMREIAPGHRGSPNGLGFTAPRKLDSCASWELGTRFW